MWFIIIATLLIGALLYKYLSKPNDFWKEYGIRQIDVSPAVGKLDILFARKTMSKGDDYAYQLMGSDPFCGLIDMGRPMILVKDLELLKKVLIKDFDHFVDRRKFFSKEDGSMSQMLPSLEGDEWKGVRSSISSTFTTGKIRRMMEYFNSVGKEWVDEYRRRAGSNPSGSVVIDVITAANQYTVEVISTTVFGMNAGIIKNPDSTFSKMVGRVVDFNKKAVMKLAFRINFPRLSRWLGFSVMDMTALAFFEGILDQGLKSRLKGETRRNDFLQLLVEAKKGELKATGSDELSSFEQEAMITTTGGGGEKKQYLTNEIMNAQSVVFFFAGFSTTSNFISFALYALALHPEVQERLREEVDKIVKEDGGLDYDDVGQLVYMDMVVCEVLRKFSATERLERICVKEYKDPEIGLTIPKGTLVGIPLNAIHHDKQYYDNPDKFDPEHFSPEKKAERNPYAYMPFGVGPRNCIGMRFAQIEAKSALAHMVHSFLIEPTPKTPVTLYGAPAGLQLIPPKKLELRLTPIANQNN